MAVGETLTAVVVERGMDWQGWLQTAAAVLAPILAVFYVELRTVPRVQRTLDEESARRSEALHREALVHSERVAAEQRRAQLLFEVRRDLEAVGEEIAAFRFGRASTANTFHMLHVFVRLERRALSAKRIVDFLDLPEVAAPMNEIIRRLHPFLVEVSTHRLGPILWSVTRQKAAWANIEGLGKLTAQAMQAVYGAVGDWVAPPPGGGGKGGAP